MAINISPTEPIFDPNFLNLEYFFNLFFRISDLITSFIAYLLGLGGADLSFLKRFLFLLILFLIFGIFYMFYKYWKIRKKERAKFRKADFDAITASTQEEKNKHWQKVLEYLETPNESDWRLAILEADNILANLLKTMQYPGETIGEQLKSIEKSDFLTLDQAWEAHKVRNQIAHDGNSMSLTRREATRVIDLYRQVFEEFHYI